MSGPLPGDLSKRRSRGGSTTVDASPSTRRRFLAGLAGLGVVGIAGCDGRGGSTTTEPPGGEGTTTDADDPGSAPEPVGPWPQARADAGNTGVVPGSGPTSDPSLRWSVTSAGTVGANVGVARGDAGDGSGLYVAAEDGRVAAVDSDGGTRWAREDEAAHFPPAVGSGRLVVPGRERLSVLDADSGTRLESVDVSAGVFGTPALVDERALVGTFSGGIVAIDLDTGERAWQVGAPSRAHPPTVADGTAYVAARRWDGGDGPSVVVAAVDVESGEILWEVGLDGEPTARPGVHDGVVYAGSNRGRVHAVDAASGDREWRESVGDWVTRGPTAAADGIYAVVLGDGVVKLTHDGTVEWRSDAGGRTNPVLAGDAAVVGTNDGILALDRDDGRTRWRVDTDAGVRFDVRVTGGRAYAGDRYGTLYAVDVEAGDRVWRRSFRPARIPGPVVGPRTVAGGSRDGGTYSLLATDGTEFPLSGGAATPGVTPAILDGRDVATGSSGGATTSDGELLFGNGTFSASGADDVAGETILGGGVDGSLFRVRTAEYGDAPGEDLEPTPTPTPTPAPGEPTATPTPHIDLPQRAPEWRARLSTDVRSPVTYADGRAYLGTADGVVAVDPRDGSMRWRVALDDQVTGAPAVDDDRLFAVTESGRLVGLAIGDAVASDARLDWEATLGSGSSAGPAVVGERVIVAGDDGNVVSYTTAGDRAWDRELDAAVAGGVAATDRRAFVGTDAAEILALNRGDGAVAWRTGTRGPVRTTPAVADGNSGRTVYVTDHGGTLSAVAAADGSVRFRHDAGRWLDAPPAVGHGAVFVADGTGRVFAVVGE